MKLSVHLLGLLLCGWWLPLGAVEQVQVCFNYGCQSEATVSYRDDQLAEIASLMAKAGHAEAERARLALAIGLLYRWAGEQSPIAADRGGNHADDGVYGKMDCIDHSTTTDRLLALLDRRGWLRWHRPIEIQRRAWFIFEHYSAAIEAQELAENFGEDAAPEFEAPDDTALLRDGWIAARPQPYSARRLVEQRFVVDSWFVPNGQAAVILPLSDWLRGEGSEVE